MLNGNNNENGKKIKRSNLEKKKNNFALAAHYFCTFFYHCFALLQSETS